VGKVRGKERGAVEAFRMLEAGEVKIPGPVTEEKDEGGEDV
jgi:hypothetical protein